MKPVLVCYVSTQLTDVEGQDEEEEMVELHVRDELSFVSKKLCSRDFILRNLFHRSRKNKEAIKSLQRNRVYSARAIVAYPKPRE